ncbi:hypothetical protein N9903_00885 [bacterium]|nr:hypothetical protein [bacterium]
MATIDSIPRRITVPPAILTATLALLLCLFPLPPGISAEGDVSLPAGAGVPAPAEGDLPVPAGEEGAAPVEEDVPVPQFIGLFDLKGKVGIKWIHDRRFETITIHRRLKGSEEPFVQVGETESVQFVDTDVEDGVIYEYYLVAVDERGRKSRPSAVRTVMLLKKMLEILSAPEWEGYLFIDNGVGLKWQARGLKEILVYNLYRKLSGAKEFELIGSTEKRNFLDRNLQGGKSYIYALTALDREFNESPFSPDLEVAIPLKEAVPEGKEAEVPWRYRRTRLVRIVTAGDEPLSRPADVAVDPKSARIYVTDTGNHKVQVFDRGGKFLRSYGGVSGSVALLGTPLGLTVDEGGIIYVIDASQNSIGIMEVGGSFRRWIGLTRFFADARMGLIDVAIDPSGRLFVVDNFNNRISIIQGGALHRFFGEPGSEPGKFSAPTFCTFDGEGRFYLSDALNGRVQVFDPQGQFLRSFGQYRQGAGGLARPKGVAVSRDGEVFVADSWKNIIQYFDSEGRLSGLLADESGKPLDLGSPNGIALDASNRIYIVERLANRLQIRDLLDEF